MQTARAKLCGIKPYQEVKLSLRDEKISIDGKLYNMEEVRFDIPVSGTVYGTLLNYRKAYKQLEPSMSQAPYHAPPNAPILYIKPRNTFSSYGAVISLPEGITELEIGAALGIVIGKTATNVKETEAFSFIEGYTIVNDVSIPHTNVYRPAIKEKSRDGFCPIGPWVIRKEAVANPNALRICVKINGEVKQENNTCNLLRPIEKLLADVTEFMTLAKGDVLLVGIPEDPPLAKVNDLVQIEIEHIGKLENKLTSKVGWEGGIT
ncbi:fumarylacetoacetate hydrolase family protein [Cerasibacillus sp. JNUCC 74]